MITPDISSLTDDLVRVARAALRAEIETLIGLQHDCNDVLHIRGPGALGMDDRRKRIADYVNSRLPAEDADS